MLGKNWWEIDVYSNGVVLLELIRSKEEIQTDQNNHASLVLWVITKTIISIAKLLDAYEQKQQNSNLHYFCFYLQARSLLDYGLGDRLIDPDLKKYDKEEMTTMMMVARLYLFSSSRRPTMKTINLWFCLVFPLMGDCSDWFYSTLLLVCWTDIEVV